MHSIVLVLSLLVSADISEQEQLLQRLDRFDKQFEQLLGIYDDVMSVEFERDECRQKIKKKHFKAGEEFHYDSMTLGTSNTILDLQIHLLKEVIEIYEIQLKKTPGNSNLEKKLIDYKKRYKVLKEFPGYD